MHNEQADLLIYFYLLHFTNVAYDVSNLLLAHIRWQRFTRLLLTSHTRAGTGIEFVFAMKSLSASVAMVRPFVVVTHCCFAVLSLSELTFCNLCTRDALRVYSGCLEVSPLIYRWILFCILFFSSPICTCIPLCVGSSVHFNLLFSFFDEEFCFRIGKPFLMRTQSVCRRYGLWSWNMGNYQWRWHWHRR